MNQIWMGLIVLAFLVAVAFFISLLIELKKTAQSFREFLKSTEDSINPTIEELQQTLKSLRKISDDINTVTGDVRAVSGAVREVGHNVKQVSNMIEDVTSCCIVKASGLKVGIKTALEVLLSNLLLKRGGK